MSTNEPGTATVVKLVDDAQISMFTTMTIDGRHVSRPMAVQSVEFDGDLWFFTYDDSDKAAQIAQHPQVNVSFSDLGAASWTSIAGTAELVHDRARAEELWSAPLKVWFPEGLETPGLALIKVHVETAEYWDSPASKVVRLLGAAKAMVTGNPDDFPGENETVTL